MNRCTRILLVTALATATGLVATVSPATAGSFCNGSNATNAPDGRIKVDGGTFIGNFNYPQAGVSAVKGIGGQAVFRYRWRNEGSDNLTIRVNLHDSIKPPGFAAQWFLKDVNVSATLKGGQALVFHNLAPGKSTPAVELVVKNKSAASGNVFQHLRGRYQGSQPNRCDMLIGAVYASV